MALAVVATPLVALSFLAPPIFELDDSFRPPSLATALVVAAVATIGAAAVGGAIGGLVVRTRPTVGTLLAFALAFPVAVTIPPLVAIAMGQPFETAYSCFDTCGPMIHAGDPLSGGGAYLVAVGISAVTIVPFVLLGVCTFGAYRLFQAGYPFISALVLGLGYGSLHWIAVLAGAPPLIGFVCLLLGVSTWAWALRTRSTAEVAAPS